MHCLHIVIQNWKKLQIYDFYLIDEINKNALVWISSPNNKIDITKTNTVATLPQAPVKCSHDVTITVAWTKICAAAYIYVSGIAISTVTLKLTVRAQPATV
jgi:hypothetical protein